MHIPLLLRSTQSNFLLRLKIQLGFLSLYVVTIALIQIHIFCLSFCLSVAASPVDLNLPPFQGMIYWNRQ